MKRVLFILAILLAFSSCAHTLRVPIKAVTNCNYDSTFVLLTYIGPYSRNAVVHQLLHPNCDANCCNTVWVDRVYRHTNGNTRFHIRFFEDEVADAHLAQRGCWLQNGQLMVWILRCPPTGIDVYATSDDNKTILHLSSDIYYKGILLDVEKHRLRVRIESIDGEEIITGWIDNSDCLCTSANGEC